MYELHHLKGNTYYIDGPTNLGVYKLNDSDCVLIDTGTKEEEKIIEEVLIKNYLNLKYIINTHCHIDHSGADSYCSYQIVDKQKVLLIYDIKGYLESLKLVESFAGNYIVPAHSDVITNPIDVINHNRNRIYEIRNLILSILENEMSIEQVIAYITNHYSLRMTHNRYLILAPTIKSYLSDLSNDGLITNYFKDNILYFKKN